MHKYDIIDEALVTAPPKAVWEALVAELRGAAQFWVPHNTFSAGPVPPEPARGAPLRSLVVGSVRRDQDFDAAVFRARLGIGGPFGLAHRHDCNRAR